MAPVDITSRMPIAPRTLEETGLPWDVVFQLVCKTLHVAGELPGAELASRLGVVFGVIESCLDLLKRDRLCEIAGGAIGPQSYVYRLTEAGHSRAAGYAEHNQYVGRLPVPIPQYNAYMREYARTGRIKVSREAVREAFKDLVLSDRVLDQLGPAIAARHSLFIYGPPGNGKTVISQAIGNLLHGHIAIPHAVSIDTEIVRLFDPLNHEPVAAGARAAGLAVQAAEDHRWVRCKRPVVTVGGELTLEALELGFTGPAGFYRAPLQMTANGGVLVIDDFGRQRISPRDLLNRWIVPLESRVDHLMLQSGQKFEVPFDVLIVFATNLNPLDLVDESFLRRLQYKVYAESPTLDEFRHIFELCCRQRGLRYDPDLVNTLIDSELRPRNVQVRGCQPRDLIEHALTLAEYTEQPRELTPELLAAACATYFLADETIDPAR